MTEIIMLRALMSELRVRAGRLRRDEKGQAVAELIIMAALAGAAIVIGKILYDKFVGKANSIPTD
jgi:hypothetical protein